MFQRRTSPQKFVVEKLKKKHKQLHAKARCRGLKEQRRTDENVQDEVLLSAVYWKHLNSWLRPLL